MTFSEQLKRVMHEKRMTQKQLSELTGIGKSSISQYVSGSNEPSKGNREKIQSVLDELKEIEIVDTKPFKNNIPISVAAKLMGKSEQFVRVGLQRGILSFGSAVKTSSKYSYYISPKLFEEYTGMKLE